MQGPSILLIGRPFFFSGSQERREWKDSVLDVLSGCMQVANLATSSEEEEGAQPEEDTMPKALKLVDPVTFEPFSHSHFQGCHLSGFE